MSDITTLMMAAAGAGGEEAGYQISRSLRFNSADSAYLNRTPASAGNRKTWTWSGWVKRSVLGVNQHIFESFPSSSPLQLTFFRWDLNNKFHVGSYDTSAYQWQLVTTAVYRDVSSWYHIVVALDTTQATSSNRLKIYINGEQVTSFSTETYPTQNTDYYVNAANIHYIGKYGNDSTRHLNGYLTEVHFVDGQALTPSDFGETDTTTGVWKPKAYAGTYGTNGFYLDFSDNTSTTTLGYDAAGSNDWTPNNFSVTAGAGNDSLVDTPTPYGEDTGGVGGTVRGNYATLNPLVSGTALSNGNLNSQYTGSGSYQNSISTMSFSSGKWYAELTITLVSGYPGFGIVDIGNVSAQNPSYTSNIGALSNEYSYFPTFGFYTGGSLAQSDTATFLSGDVVGIAIDLDSAQNTFKIYQNGSLVETLNINGPNNAYAFADSFITTYQAARAVWNFGQRPFAYTAPSGFKALCTQNLPTPTVVQGDDYFNTVLYTGTGSAQSITGVGFQPDWVWIKERSGVADHGLYDAVRGVQQQLESNTTTAETTESTGLTAFGSDGFTVGALAQLNTNTDTYVAWNWNAGGSNATNTDGTITSTVRANPTAGFSIVSYTGTGSAATVGHGLGAAPAMIIVKNRDQADAWQVYHKANTAAPETDYLVLNTTAATADAADRWNDTAPTSTVFSIGNGVEVNTNTEDYIAYVFAEVEGFSKFGSYTGNGSTDGPFVYCGFRPAFVMFKNASVTSEWNMYDSTRDTYNFADAILRANLSDAETNGGANPNILDLLSNGFKIRYTGTNLNGSGNTIIFMAFAENPFKYSLAR